MPSLTCRATTAVAVIALALTACDGGADTDVVPDDAPDQSVDGADDEAPEDAASESNGDRQEVAGVVECASLVGSIDEEVVASITDLTADDYVMGCWMDGSDGVQMSGSVYCDDGRVIVAAGDRAGVEGGEWEAWDPDSDLMYKDVLC